MSTNCIMVSVCMITYNHEPYIRKAVEGVLMQQCTFDFELIIGEDFSTDKTRKICQEFSSQYPNIKLLPSEMNLGMKKNFVRTLNSCSGKYIALCEGDDYWTDPYKLQKEFDFLEANIDYGMICTDYHKYYQINGIFKKNCFNNAKYKNGIQFNDYILDRSTIGTATVMFRSSLVKKLEKDIPFNIWTNWNVGDTALWLYISLISKIKVLPNVTAVYRINQNSASKFTDVHKKYQFRIKGFDIPFFFLDFSNADQQLRKKVEISYNSMFIRYRFDAKDPAIGNENYGKLRELGAINFDIWIRYNCYNKHYLARYFFFPLSYTIRKVKNLVNRVIKLNRL